MVIRLVFGHEEIFPSIEHLADALIRQVPVFGDRNAAFLVYREEGLSPITRVCPPMQVLLRAERWRQSLWCATLGISF